jgi:hypothetical protein
VYGGSPREALVEHAGQGVDVGSVIGCGAFDLLGRDVVDGTEKLTGCREAGRRRGLLREPEVGEIDMVALGDEDVGRLDVAMD